MLKLGRGRNQLRLARNAEELLKVQRLPLVGQVQKLVRMIVVLALDDGCKIGRGVECCAVGLDQNAGRDFLCVALLLHRHDQRTVGLDSQMLFLNDFQQLGNIRLRVAFAQPHVKRHVQRAVVLFQVRDGHAQNVLPQVVIAALPVLKLFCRLMRAARKCFVRLAARGGRRIDFLQIGDGKRRFGGILAGEALVKIGELRMALAQALDDKPHLKAPVAQMHVADDTVSEEAVDALDGLADDGRAQMADVQRLCHVRAAVVYDNRARRALRLHAEVIVRGHFAQIRGQFLTGHAQIQKARLDRRDLGKQRVFRKLRRDVLGDLNRRLVI